MNFFSNKELQQNRKKIAEHIARVKALANNVHKLANEDKEELPDESDSHENVTFEQNSNIVWSD